MTEKDIMYLGIDINEIPGKHLTLQFFGGRISPQKVEALSSVIGKEVTLEVTHSGVYKNAITAFKVDLPECIEELFKGNIPHVTLSVAEGYKPAEAWKCFTVYGEYTPHHETITGKVWFFGKDNRPIGESA